MKKNNILLIILILVFSFCLTDTIKAEKEKEDIQFYGSFLMGYRGVDLSDHSMKTKFKEDYNLESGARLFNFNVHFLPKGYLKKIFDRFDLTVRNFGGDPFETFSLSIAKYGKYQFNYDRRKSSYFYQDKLTGDDFHHFDFDRVLDSATLKVWITKSLQLYADLNSSSKKGLSTTTLDISHEEYEFDKPVDESSNEFSFGLGYNSKGISLLWMERLQDYKNDYRLFLPGYSQGEDQEINDVKELNFFFLNQPYDFRGITHSLKLNLSPGDKLIIDASVDISDTDMRISYSERANGVKYTGFELDYANNGYGFIDRKTKMFDIDLTYLANDKMAIVAGVRYNDFAQDGSMTINGTETSTELDYDNLSVETALQYQLNSWLGFSAGFRSETRNVTMESGGEEETTKRTGLFGNLKMKLFKKLRLTADFQNGSYTDPFTLVSPKKYQRIRLTGKYKVKKIFFSGSFLYDKTENNVDDDWKSDKYQYNLRTGYHDKKVYFSLGYSFIDIRQVGDRMLSNYGPPAYWAILYEGEATLIDIYFQYILSKKISAGAYFNSYKNKGSWELERTMGKAFIKFELCNGFLTQLIFRSVEFKETMYNYNNYNANILEVSFGYKWK